MPPDMRYATESEERRPGGGRIAVPFAASPGGRPDAVTGSGIHDRWGLILAGGDGTGLRPLTRRIENDHRPKQFCRLLDNETLLDRTRRRTALVIPPERTLVLVTRRHERFYAPLLEHAPAGCVVRQAQNRGTAPAILYGLLRVSAAAPMAAVGLFPSDHYVSDDSVFMGHVGIAFEAVRARPDLIVLLGIDADQPEPAYGWIEPGDSLPAGPGRQLSRVRRFWEKPPRPVAEALLASGALWNSFVIVARVPALLGLMKHAVPALFQAFDGARAAINTGSEPERFSALYVRLVSTDFSERVLAPRPANLAVLKVTGVAWSDLGEPGRVMTVLARVGIEPEWARPAVRA